MSFGGNGKTTRGFTISGLNETLSGIDSLREDLHTRTRRAILTDAATFFKNDAVSNAHVITGKTKGSIKIESVTDREAIISAGFGMPFEEKRTGTKDGTPHMTMTEAANNTRKEMPSIIDKHMKDLLNRHKTTTG
jgi:HK97 gp10 family phage protein